MQPKKKVLCFFDYFYPAFMSGGPARSSLGIVEYLGPYYELKVITRDRDTYDKNPMSGIVPNQWNSIKDIKVYYLTVARYWNMLTAIQNGASDVYYFNSFFSLKLTLLPLLLINFGSTKGRKIIVAPRGELSPGAVQLKGFKKGLFIKLFRPLYSRLAFHASSELEKKDIQHFFPKSSISVALNLRPRSEFDALRYMPSQKEKQKIRIVYLSRIDRKKNIEFALKVLGACKADIVFDIYAIIDDPGYWALCKERIEQLNQKKNLRISYKGSVSSHETFSIISQYDLMLFTSLGENFSHSILECFMASRPALISDTTYWRALEKNQAGWDFSLENPRRFSEKIEEVTEMTREEFDKYCAGAYRVASEYFNDPSRINDYKILFG